mmetsp:Transcript_41327/g.101828  ORF Transcript_41327/g.101828 Transcript_41327/m.101828 type:complete len:182 (-) Transcript_41327:46-591(-)|eukprot:CAMPEP_0197575092 /NCGR_PEP_ID=MMETSP1326-20131121/610_1 /TAXON_ID=1155430 /ORGANISM="Genus nov. species nov., Strain RCC2288" /LENGTH=181 /DNA_ID=CAMNT_0043137795 /DNA_START=57 /DNA_END=602 /DNA_ORIENTATION=-
MASGFGAKGQEGRCYPLWTNFSACMSTADDPMECRNLREDYFECLHHKKEYTRISTINKEANKQMNEAYDAERAEMWRIAFLTGEARKAAVEQRDRKRGYKYTSAMDNRATEAGIWMGFGAVAGATTSGLQQFMHYTLRNPPSKSRMPVTLIYSGIGALIFVAPMMMPAKPTAAPAEEAEA